MEMLRLEFYVRHTASIAIIAIAICVLAWVAEFADYVYVCPYCRAQRTVIGILGLLLLLPASSHWTVKYIAIVIGFFGAVIGANQHFAGWRKISGGEFKFNDTILIDPFLLSGAAVTAIIGLTLLIVLKKSNRDTLTTGNDA